MLRVRSSPVSLAALLVYLAVNVAGPGLHTHASQLGFAGRTALCKGGGEMRAAPAAEADDDQHACPICAILHQAQAQAKIVQVVVFSDRTGEAATSHFTQKALAIPATTHSRAPPIS